MKDLIRDICLKGLCSEIFRLYFLFTHIYTYIPHPGPWVILLSYFEYDTEFAEIFKFEALWSAYPPESSTLPYI
jgi:hypothetical protein